MPLLFVAGCNSEDTSGGPDIPIVPIYEELNLTNIQYQPLQTQGWIYYDAGYQGLLIVKESNTYRVFDRACPVDFQESCGRVNMHSSGFFIEDADCCKSNFDLSGQPSGGPARKSLRAYPVRQSGNFLIIEN